MSKILNWRQQQTASMLFLIPAAILRLYLILPEFILHNFTMCLTWNLMQSFCDVYQAAQLQQIFTKTYLHSGDVQHHWFSVWSKTKWNQSWYCQNQYDTHTLHTLPKLNVLRGEEKNKAFQITSTKYDWNKGAQSSGTFRTGTVSHKMQNHVLQVKC